MSSKMAGTRRHTGGGRRPCRRPCRWYHVCMVYAAITCTVSAQAPNNSTHDQVEPPSHNQSLSIKNTNATEGIILPEPSHNATEGLIPPEPDDDLFEEMEEALEEEAFTSTNPMNLSSAALNDVMSVETDNSNVTETPIENNTSTTSFASRPQRPQQEGAYSRLTDLNIHFAIQLWQDNQQHARAVFGDIKDWDMVRVTDLDHALEHVNHFHADLSKWNIRSVTSMAHLLDHTRQSSVNVTGWNTRRVTDLSFVVAFCDDLEMVGMDTWKTPSVTDLTGAFRGMTTTNLNATHLDLSGWDVTQVTSMDRMFEQTSGLTIHATHWKLSSLRYARFLFADSDELYVDVTGWDVSRVQDFQGLFMGAQALELPGVEGWNVEAVTSLQQLFQETEDFPLNLSQWNTTAATNWDQLLDGSSNFPTATIASWNTASATSMLRLFAGTRDMTGDFSLWNTSRVVNMQGVFRDTRNFAAQVAHWDVSSATDLSYIFRSCRNFTSDVSNWDTSLATDWTGAFQGTNKFNVDLSGWSTKNAETFWGIFRSTTGFNAPGVKDWDTSNVKTLAYALARVEDFQADLNWWNTAQVTSLERTFEKTVEFYLNLNKWKTSNVQTMNNAFDGAKEFAGVIGAWNVRAVTDMSHIFHLTENFHTGISRWKTSNVTSFESAFAKSKNFHSTISEWDFSSAQTLRGMFESSRGFDGGDLSRMNTANVLDMSRVFYDAPWFNQAVCWSTKSMDMATLEEFSCLSYGGMDCSCMSIPEVRPPENGIRDEGDDEMMAARDRADFVPTTHLCTRLNLRCQRNKNRPRPLQCTAYDSPFAPGVLDPRPRDPFICADITDPEEEGEEGPVLGFNDQAFQMSGSRETQAPATEGDESGALYILQPGSFLMVAVLPSIWGTFVWL